MDKNYPLIKYVLFITIFCFSIHLSHGQDLDGDGIPDASDVDDDNDGIPDIDEGSCVPIINNASLETPLLTSSTPFIQSFDNGNLKIYHQDDVPFWGTTATDNGIEIWGNDNTLSSPHADAHSGIQFAEINAFEVAAIYQDVNLAPGITVQWSIAHRGRDGVESATVAIGAPGNLTVVETMSTNNTNWIIYSGTYEVPSGEITTRFQFESLNSGSTGNFLDSFNLTCLNATDTDGDGVPDYQDLDSDNDGINDVDEGGNGNQDINRDGVIDANDTGYSDTNMDGQADGAVDVVEGPDSDGDGVPDYQDLDSDDDGIVDVIEGNNSDADTNNDGVIDSEDTAGGDSDGDGIADAVDEDPNNYGDLGNNDNPGNNTSDPTDPNSGGTGSVGDSGTDNDGDGIADSVDDCDTVEGTPEFGLCDGTTLTINDLPLDTSHVTIYPNPANRIITIQLPNEVNTAAVVIYNITGQKVLQLNQSSVNKKIKINLPNITTGVYLLSITTEKNTISKRIIIKN